MDIWRRLRSSVLALGMALAADPLLAEEAALAEEASADASLATALSQVRTYGRLPAGFVAATARPSVLARHGLPPRPDREADPDGYAAWLLDVDPAIVREVPRLRQTMTRNRREASGKAANRQPSNNWSGVVATSPVTQYGQGSFQSVHAAWTVPAIQPPFGTCAKDPDTDAYQMSIWPGIGGYGQPGLLQAGTSAAARCSGGDTQVEHWAWYEFYPFPSVTIDTLPADAGHVISVYVWSTSPRDGHAHIVNRTLARSASFRFKAPRGSRLVGDSAEWIVERPSIDGVPSDLANYTETVIYEASATTGRGDRVLGGSGELPRGIERVRLTMQEDGGGTLSVADIVGRRAIRFRARGAARDGRE